MSTTIEGLVDAAFLGGCWNWRTGGRPVATGTGIGENLDIVGVSGGSDRGNHIARVDSGGFGTGT
jgi:hypothetical protein